MPQLAYFFAAINWLLHFAMAVLHMILMVFGVIIALGLILLIFKALKGRAQLSEQHGLLQLYRTTKFEKFQAISLRLYKERKKLLKLTEEEPAGGNGNKSSEPAPAKPDEKPTKPVAVIKFDGDILASARKSFAQLVDELLANYERIDSVVVVVSSPGGGVSHYGQMFSEMERIRDIGLNLTVCVDTYAASGGYLMSLPAHKIVAAPYALVGSIGVVAEFVNGYKFLKERGLEPVTLTAGKYKRTITPLAPITEANKRHFQQHLDAIHRLFIESVKKYRKTMNTNNVCTGDYWTAKESVDLKLGLVDELGTSQDFLFKINQDKDLVVLSQKKNPLEQSILRIGAYVIELAAGKIFPSGFIS